MDQGPTVEVTPSSKLHYEPTTNKAVGWMQWRWNEFGSGEAHPGSLKVARLHNR